MKLSGKALRYGDHVDTDVIIPARYLNSSDPMELASHCMEDIDKDFLKRLQPGDIIAAGVNFGCGSSREHAPLAIKSAGVGAVVAKSFARIFYRNSVNIGLPIVVSNLDIAEGDQEEVDLDAGILYNQTHGTEDHFPPFSPFLQDVIHAGGLMNALKDVKL